MVEHPCFLQRWCHSIFSVKSIHAAMICGELLKTKNSDSRSTNLKFNTYVNMQVQSVFKCNDVSIILHSGFIRYQLVFEGFTLTLSMPSYHYLAVK